MFKINFRNSMFPRFCRRPLFGVWLAGLFFCGVWCGCSDTRSSRLSVAVTIPPLQKWTEQLTGGRVDVVCAVPDGGNPESYDLPPSAMVELSRCRLYFSCGYLGFERTWLDRLADNNPDLRVVNLSGGLPLIYGSHHHHAEAGHSHASDEPFPDPHIWCSPRLARHIVTAMYQALVEVDSAGAPFYAERYRHLDRELAQLDSTLAARLLPLQGKAFAVYHPTLSYWAAEYGLRQLALEPDGKSPSPQYLRAMVDSARSAGVEVVFIQQEFDPRQAATFAREVGCRTEVINPLAYDWNEEIMRITDAFTR